MPTTDQRNLLTINEVSFLLGLSNSYTRSLVNSGRIPGIKFGRDWVVDGEIVEQYRLSKEFSNAQG